jgi:hypothetical protein
MIPGGTSWNSCLNQWAVLRIWIIFFIIRIRIHKNFFRIRIRILWAYNLTHIIQKLSFNSKRTVSVISRRKKICYSTNMCFFSFKSLVCHAVPVLLKCTVWIRIRIRIRIFIWIRIRIQLNVSDSLRFGSATLPMRTSEMLPAFCWLSMPVHVVP